MIRPPLAPYFRPVGFRSHAPAMPILSFPWVFAFTPQVLYSPGYHPVSSCFGISHAPAVGPWFFISFFGLYLASDWFESLAQCSTQAHFRGFTSGNMPQPNYDDSQLFYSRMTCIFSITVCPVLRPDLPLICKESFTAARPPVCADLPSCSKAADVLSVFRLNDVSSHLFHAVIASNSAAISRRI